MAKTISPPTYDITLRQRTAYRSKEFPDGDPTRDTFSIWIAGHSTCKGIPRRVAYTGPKLLDESGEQIGGRICWIVQHQLHKADMLRVAEFVSKWQADEAAMEASRENPDETT